MKSSRDMLRVGLIIDEGELDCFSWTLIDAAEDSEYFTIAGLVVQCRAEGKISRIKSLFKKNGILWLLNRIIFLLFYKVEKYLISYFFNKQLLNEKRQLEAYSNIKKVFVQPSISDGGNIYKYSDDDLSHIERENFDVLVRCGSGILRGKILNITQYGIISFHHGDNSKFRGSPAGFWEVLLREYETKFIIQRLSDNLDGGEVLYSGAISTKPFFTLNQLSVYEKSLPFMIKVLNSMGGKGSIPKPADIIFHDRKIYFPPSIFIILYYVGLTVIYILKKVFYKVTGLKQKWHIAYKQQENWKNSAFYKFKEIKNRTNHFCADPFIIEVQNKYYILFEEYSYLTKKGVISAICLDSGDLHEINTVLVEDFHLSFPYLLKVGEDIYMIPETHEANEIRMYRATKFPERWELHKILKRDVRAVDTMLIPVTDGWVMLTNIDTGGNDDFDSELHAFFSNTFDSDVWHPVSDYPIIFTPKRARNGGILFQGNDAYRVFQRQEKFVYGAKMGVSKIEYIAKDGYQETELVEVAPDFISRGIACHTMNSNDKYTVIDYAKRER